MFMGHNVTFVWCVAGHLFMSSTICVIYVVEGLRRSVELKTTKVETGSNIRLIASCTRVVLWAEGGEGIYWRIGPIGKPKWHSRKPPPLTPASEPSSLPLLGTKKTNLRASQMALKFLLLPSSSRAWMHTAILVVHDFFEAAQLVFTSTNPSSGSGVFVLNFSIETWNES